MNEEEYNLLLGLSNSDQQQKLKAYYKHQSYVKTAKALGKDESTIRNTIKRLRKKAARIKAINGKTDDDVEAYAPLKCISQYYDKDGNPAGKWLKRDVAKEHQLKALEEAIEAIMEKVKPAKPTSIPKYKEKDSMTVYTIGDAHIGMLAWHRETGADHNLELAEEDLLKAMYMLTTQSLSTEECFIVDVGDFFHSDNMDNKTAKSGNSLDVDGRYPKVLEIGLRLTTKLIDIALNKHKIVHWRSAIGNHNEHSAMMMSAFIKAYYRNEPRVMVHDTPNMFMYHQFGKNLIGITHGHTAKAEKLGEIMSVDCEDIWSSTKYRYWYTGHIHHQSVKEFPSCVVETFRTLAGKDSWHSASGYRSGQDMRAILLHKEYGEITRNTVNLAQVRAKYMV